METTIVLMDNCDDSLLGVLTVKDKTSEEVNAVFHEVMTKLPGEWSLDDLLDELRERNIEFSWLEEESVTVLSI